MKLPLFFLLLCVVLCGCADPNQDVVHIRVATASNFVGTLGPIVEEFSKSSGIKVSLSTASTGALFAQIENGAPFDVFLAADEARPQALIKNGLADSESAFVYAQGRLALVAGKGSVLPQDLEHLIRLSPMDLTIANPKLAPFGQAALEVLNQTEKDLGAKGIRLIRGENVAQSYAFLNLGTADFGILPLSLAKSGDLAYLEIDDALFKPVNQMGVVIASTNSIIEAKLFLKNLNEASARSRIKESGYNVIGP